MCGLQELHGEEVPKVLDDEVEATVILLVCSLGWKHSFDVGAVLPRGGYVM